MTRRTIPAAVALALLLLAWVSACRTASGQQPDPAPGIPATATSQTTGAP